MNQRLLFISPNQFGYFSIYYNYCKLLKKDYEITYICFDQGLEKIILDNIDVIYLKHSKNSLSKHIAMFRSIRSVLKELHFNAVLMKYFRFCSINGLIFRSENIFIDIRTGFIKDSWVTRKFMNWFIKVESLFFKKVLVLSDDLKKELNLSNSKTFVIPLGGNCYNGRVSDFNSLRLLYLGVLDKRNINETIRGLGSFISHNSFPVSYDIIGYGTPEEEEKVRTTITELSLDEKVKFHGRIFGDRLIPFFEKCNVGIAYLPSSNGYDIQPLTKIYEYLLAGMVVIASSTSENRKVIQDNNGVIICNTPKSFDEGLQRIIKNAYSYDIKEIMNSVIEFSWENIVEKKLKPLLIN